MIITGYKFLNINAFNASNALCNDYFGIPVNKESVTQNWIEPQKSYKVDDSLDFYYIEGSISPVLGFPTEFEVRNLPIDINI